MFIYVLFHYQNDVVTNVNCFSVQKPELDAWDTIYARTKDDKNLTSTDNKKWACLSVSRDPRRGQNANDAP